MSIQACSECTAYVLRVVIDKQDVLGLGIDQVANVSKRLGMRLTHADLVRQKQGIKVRERIRVSVQKRRRMYRIGIAKRITRSVVQCLAAVTPPGRKAQSK